MKQSIEHTAASWAPCICSTKPVKRIFGRFAVQSLLSCSSARERKALSPDDNACRSCVKVVWTSGGSMDILLAFVMSLHMICWYRTRLWNGVRVAWKLPLSDTLFGL